jgi:hypothetical protein
MTVDLNAVLNQALAALAVLLPLLLWCLFWLLAVNWGRAWPVLAAGGWAPVVLLALVVALVWSRLAPSSWDFYGLVTVPNFWWQLGAAGVLVASALFCGWLQQALRWSPGEVDVGPPPGAVDLHGHEHPVGTFHGHEYAHADEDSTPAPPDHHGAG